MFPADSNPTPVILRLQDLIDSSTVKGLMEDTSVGNEDQWDEDHMWLIPSVTIWEHLCFNYEVMTDLINGRFIEDFGILLGSATGEAKTRKSFYEIDKEFELMTKTIEKNFVKVDILMVFMCVSLVKLSSPSYQRLVSIRKLGAKLKITFLVSLTKIRC